MITGMDSVERIATRTRELRLACNLTQQEFAELADMSEKFLQQIEARRKKQIWLSTVEQIANGFGLELHEFLAPEAPRISKLAKKVASSRVHKK